MDIDGFRQNKPSLIARDFEKLGIPFDESMKILLFRGVFKWLAVRRKLIKVKDTWKDEIKETLSNIKQAKLTGDRKILWYRGYLASFERCRKEIRALCHSSRWQAPDFDKKARVFLSKYMSCEDKEEEPKNSK